MPKTRPPQGPIAPEAATWSPGAVAATLRPHDAEAAAMLAGRFAEKGNAERAFGATAQGAALLAALGGHSPYLADLALRESATLLRLVERGPDATFALALDPLSRADPAATRPGVASLLRQAKRQAALIAAVADILGLWPLDRVTGALSDLADACTDYACAHLLREAQARGDLKLAGGAARHDPRATGKGSGLVVLGMGKLGGRELNYSSDIDLMVLYDPEAAAYDADRAGAIYVRLARDLVRLMEERTEDGYVFRTDLRLRPDPAATPLAVSLPAAIVYYESMGQNWERAAMIKARPVAGDRALGEHFLREIRPFVWRRHLDFAAVADIHSIKRQIHAHKGHKGANASVQVAGHDVKLGRGGIREIEFTTQVLQLIWGGRDPVLRDPTTLGALAALAASGKIDRRAAADLADAYGFLRMVEHRLQMVADRQTHRLPEDEAGLALIASFLGFDGAAAFSAALVGHLTKVERRYAGLFEEAPDLSAGDGAEGDLVFTGVEDDPGTLETLRGMGFQNPSAIAGVVRGWHHGRTRATRSERARELLTALMPALLAAFGRQPQPDAALLRLDTALGRLPAGVQVLSLLARNPALLDRLAFVLGAAPQLADHFSRNAAALDGLLAGAGGVFNAAGTDPTAALPALVKDARFLEEALEAARRLVTERKFEVDAAALEGRIDVDEAGIARSTLADAAIGGLLPRIAQDFARRHGKVAGGNLGVVALGKLGGRDMLPGSDLDLILVYDHAEDATESTGGQKVLAASQYFGRLANQVVGALTAPGAEGRLYEVDMRLRPSGSKGPVAVSLPAFERYHAESAWTWERMALTRARFVAGAPGLRRKVEAAIRQAQIRPADAATVLADATAMRARLLRDLPGDGPWDVKHRAGGLIEVEFIAQALQVAHGARLPAILSPTTRLALAALAKARILPAEEAEGLVAAERLWRAITAHLRLTVGQWREEALPEPVAAALLRALSTAMPHSPVDQAALRAQMRDAAIRVRDSFIRHVGDPTIPPA
ncbi:bifunctional [glutamine synthetase] adenylyltransferase/[glutamine synthetase]-adenylyl-L-tyrosine phosphorylase [Falsiroseomonas sp.]|uniref:bifunctional [glutamine synthetase] adenylyltransferase/[glutamine synthetase]-adenylyl-L-tyrosine phosphorylase n=1 Tax=Falsiroseomonas sp. TaxID=2870721 RepID=UPI003F6FE9AC